MSSLKEKFAVFKKRGTEVLAKHSDTLIKVGTALQVVSSGIPFGGAVVAAFGGVISYAAQKAAEGHAEAQKLAQALQFLLEELEDVQKVLITYSEVQMKESQLAKEVAVIYKCVAHWSAQIDKGEKPDDIMASLQRKNTRLHTSVQAEILRVAVRAEKKLDGVADDVKSVAADMKKLALKAEEEGTPDAIYQKAKDDLTSGKYMAAEKGFNEYRRLVYDEKKTTTKSLEADNSLRYLVEVWDNIKLTSFSLVKEVNPYQDKLEEWEREVAALQRGRGDMPYVTRETSLSPSVTSSSFPPTPSGPRPAPTSGRSPTGYGDYSGTQKRE